MVSLIIPNEIFFLHIFLEINSYKAVKIPVKGSSMLPFIRPLSDEIELTGLNEESITKGNIVLARTSENKFIVHRIEKVEKDVITLRGDGNLSLREQCDKKNIFAEVTAVYKKKRTIRKGSFEWNLAKECWFSSPLLRRIYLKIDRSMKNLFYFLIVVAFLAACSGPRGMVKIEMEGNEAAQEDSVEYELVVFDTGFETWYALQNSPARYRSQQYYEGWNQQYVSEWNYLATQPRRRSFFQPIVGYEPGVDYGFELNHKLFYYFQYVERVLRIPILSNHPSGVIY